MIIGRESVRFSFDEVAKRGDKITKWESFIS